MNSLNCFIKHIFRGKVPLSVEQVVDAEILEGLTFITLFQAQIVFSSDGSEEQPQLNPWAATHDMNHLDVAKKTSEYISIQYDIFSFSR